MNIRFQADADFNQIIVSATIRIEPMIDFRTAHIAGIAGLPDPEVLSIAAREGRILVSHDQRTMPHHFSTFIANHHSSGLLIVPQSLSLSSVVQELLLIWSASSPEEWVNSIACLPL